MKKLKVEVLFCARRVEKGKAGEWEIPIPSGGESVTLVRQFFSTLK